VPVAKASWGKKKRPKNVVGAQNKRQDCTRKKGKTGRGGYTFKAAKGVARKKSPEKTIGMKDPLKEGFPQKGDKVSESEKKKGGPYPRRREKGTIENAKSEKGGGAGDCRAKLFGKKLLIAKKGEMKWGDSGQGGPSRMESVFGGVLRTE